MFEQNYKSLNSSIESLSFKSEIILQSHLDSTHDVGIVVDELN